MTQTICRIYNTPEQAHRAAEALTQHPVYGFKDVHVVAYLSAAPIPMIVERLMKAFVLKAHARRYAETISRGGSLVAVHALFGTAAAAIEILERHGPIDSGVAEPRDPPMAWDEAAPLSSALQLPVLLPDSDSFSRFWNLPLLTRRGGTTGSAFGLPEVSSTTGPFKGTFGMPLLSDKAAPLSSMLGLPVLTRPAPARR